VFYQPYPVRAAKQMAPYFAAVTLGLMTLMVAFKGLKDVWRRIEMKTDNVWFVLAVFTVAGALSLIALLVMRYLVRDFHSHAEAQGEGNLHPEVSRSLSKTIKHLQRVTNSSSGELKQQAEKLMKEAQRLEAGALRQAKSFDNSPELRQVERVFIGLQVITACFVAFAHGANDVANAIGPLSAAYQAIDARTISAKATTPTWALYLGGAGIVAGLAMWGFKVIRTVGERITELTPSRGFCAEFSASLTIMLGTIMGLPLSTTHTLVGAVLGIGLAKGINALNLRVLRDIVASWIVTVPIGALLCVLFYVLLKLVFIDSGWFVTTS
jgi:phosphate/sulfate permease